ncbi:hypothetical protein Cob_v010386 [Colletotrichum orbiculare MAFF 240422]|uniref:Uncharacterized protein n=1 Tax=Colletotrichum orbiculare (strain 104-T / ATCC 96160 / CBS 514.97 / LARS 414 / MAFF 240422) TaxID=1213857 RepID=N4VHR4_COLOR|nr:hypothetical protein Cob_v010386 [Colletotrichum orbiculare MAFF 240422]
MPNDDLPIALRRSRRSQGSTAAPVAEPSGSQTPRRTSKQRVRFSEPGLSTPRTTTRISSTGLTPSLRRAALASGTPKSARRHSAPVARISSSSGTPADEPLSGEVHFLPLRQVLDGRVQRRIRRNGLSEEMNAITAEKRRRAQETKSELEELRRLLKEKDAEIYELQNATIVLDTDRIWGLEKEVESLKEELANRATGNANRSCYDWTMAARGPYADEFMETDTIEAESVAGERMVLGDDTAFGDATAADFVCGTPTRVRSSFPRSSFMSPPLTSPVAAAPMTPSSHRGDAPMLFDTGVQVVFPDTQKKELEEEVKSLRLEMAKLTNTLESYTSLTTRLSTTLSAYSSENASSDPIHAIEEQTSALLRTISDRTAALLELNKSLSNLGFPGSDASEIIISLASALRTARLELEYLTPGEITLPLTSHGAEVLDLLLTRLRDLAKRAREDEAAIDEYHELELSLRQQLGARVTAMNDLDAELKEAKAQLRQRDGKVEELEVSVDRLKGAVNGYIRDVMELEGVIGKTERENRDALATKDAQVEVGRRVLRSKEDVIAQLEGKLADAVAQVRVLKKRLEESEQSRVKEVAKVNQRSGQVLADRDARVKELRGEVERVNESLRAAHDGIKSLRVEKIGLEGKLKDERNAAKKVIDQMKGELERVVGMSREFLNDAGTPKKGKRAEGATEAAGAEGAVVKRGLFSGDLTSRTSGTKRRRYDSGLGFLDEDEVDA